MHMAHAAESSASAGTRKVAQREQRLKKAPTSGRVDQSGKARYSDALIQRVC